MRIDVLTLFPDMFDGFLRNSIIKRAIDSGKVEINLIDFRKYSKDKHKRVDDYAFGGGKGMVLMCQPIFDAIDDLKDDDCFVILMSPQGQVYKESLALDLSKKKHLIIICGHYEGFDERIRTLADLEISIGDYVLTGGEIPSMVIMDSCIRLLDGVIERESYENDSFSNGLLDYPVYTHPRVYRGLSVPDVLLSGNHKLIREYREKEAMNKTRVRRPDLLEKK